MSMHASTPPASMTSTPRHMDVLVSTSVGIGRFDEELAPSRSKCHRISSPTRTKSYLLINERTLRRAAWSSTFSSRLSCSMVTGPPPKDADTTESVSVDSVR